MNNELYDNSVPRLSRKNDTETHEGKRELEAKLKIDSVRPPAGSKASRFGSRKSFEWSL